jgi:hypothetical protein
LPSRVRSPTPANTAKPPCSAAMFRMSSWIMTVFPVPARRRHRPCFLSRRGDEVNNLQTGLKTCGLVTSS